MLIAASLLPLCDDTHFSVFLKSVYHDLQYLNFCNIFLVIFL